MADLNYIGRTADKLSRDQRLIVQRLGQELERLEKDLGRNKELKWKIAPNRLKEVLSSHRAKKEYARKEPPWIYR